jgi:hypothetical protein
MNLRFFKDRDLMIDNADRRWFAILVIPIEFTFRTNSPFLMTVVLKAARNSNQSYSRMNCDWRKSRNHAFWIARWNWFAFYEGCNSSKLKSNTIESESQLKRTEELCFTKSSFNSSFISRDVALILLLCPIAMRKPRRVTIAKYASDIHNFHRINVWQGNPCVALGRLL